MKAKVLASASRISSSDVSGFEKVRVACWLGVTDPSADTAAAASVAAATVAAPCGVTSPPTAVASGAATSRSLSAASPCKPRVSLWISSNCCRPTFSQSSLRRRDSCCCASFCAEICAVSSGLWYVNRSRSLGKSGREIKCTACVNIVSGGWASKLCVFGNKPIHVSHSCGGWRRYLLMRGSGSTTCQSTTLPCCKRLRTRSFKTKLSGQFIKSIPVAFTKLGHSKRQRPSTIVNSLYRS
mmetsp:Transcript_109534/g.217513  ORF Transcript_109534/g.217513 Transcript_109534/m.217513 type:complete len:240 (+) Transcript_109534:748-1467(+)